MHAPRLLLGATHHFEGGNKALVRIILFEMHYANTTRPSLSNRMKPPRTRKRSHYIISLRVKGARFVWGGPVLAQASSLLGAVLFCAGIMCVNSLALGRDGGIGGDRRFHECRNRLCLVDRIHVQS
jgi:hypothetical protein